MSNSWKWIFVFCTAFALLIVVLASQPVHYTISVFADPPKTNEIDPQFSGSHPPPGSSGNATPSISLPQADISQDEQPPIPTAQETQGVATIAVCPQIVNVTSSDSFMINVTITNVTELYCYDIRLRYDNATISATEINMGDFLPKDSWFIRREISQAKGTVWVAVCSPLGSKVGVSGNGTLATIRFDAISKGNCGLEFYYTMLVKNGTFNDIPHNRVGGYVSCNIYEHETAVYLNAPAYIKPGYSCLISGTVANRGLYDEKDVALQLLVDGEVVNSATVDSLTTGSLANLTYLFAPTQEGVYSWEMRVRSVPNEEYAENNLASTSIRVRNQLRVPQDYPTIQEAIADAVAGETVAVASGTYYEHVGIDRPLTIIGESCNNTIIDGGSDNRAVIVIHADNVSLAGFTIRNGGNGIFLDHSNGTVITNNVVADTMDAVFVQFSHNNTIIFNTIRDNDGGIFISGSNDNMINHNVFINNSEQAWTMDSHNAWDNGLEGNYWSNYNGGDSNGDGIGDTPYMIDQDNQDNYPLIGDQFG